MMADSDLGEIVDVAMQKAHDMGREVERFAGMLRESKGEVSALKSELDVFEGKLRCEQDTLTYTRGCNQQLRNDLAECEELQGDTREALEAAVYSQKKLLSFARAVALFRECDSDSSARIVVHAHELSDEFKQINSDDKALGLHVTLKNGGGTLNVDGSFDPIPRKFQDSDGV